MKYIEYWGLTRNPFDAAFDEQLFFPSENHRVSLAKLSWAIEQRHTAALLTGTLGMGKTLLATMLRKQLGSDFDPVPHIVFPPSNTPSLMAYLAEELAAHRKERRHVDNPEVHHTIRALEEFLRNNTMRGKHAVILLDEAHTLREGNVLEALSMLLNFKVEGHSLCTLVLIGQPELLENLQQTPALEGRIAMKCTLQPLTEQETAAYVQHRIDAVGGNVDIFQRDALEAVHAFSGGVPTLINCICDLALLLCFGEALGSVSADEIESVNQEISQEMATY